MIWTNKVRFNILFSPHLLDYLTLSVDEEWLNAVNEDRRKNQLDKIDPELFEIMMDRLEKEWFDLVRLYHVFLEMWLTLVCAFQTKNLQKPDLAMPSEDSTCAICDDSEGENSNAIVFCDGCNLAVHQGNSWLILTDIKLKASLDCYGVPYIPEGQWLCRKCTVSPENPVVSLSDSSAINLFNNHSRNVFCVPMKVGHSSKLYMENGFTFSVPFGSLRHELQMKFSWNLSREWIKFRDHVGNWFAFVWNLLVLFNWIFMCRNAVSVISGQGHVFNVLKVPAFWRSTLRALGKRNYYCLWRVLTEPNRWHWPPTANATFRYAQSHISGDFY